MRTSPTSWYVFELVDRCRFGKYARRYQATKKHSPLNSSRPSKSPLKYGLWRQTRFTRPVPHQFHTLEPSKENPEKVALLMVARMYAALSYCFRFKFLLLWVVLYFAYFFRGEREGVRRVWRGRGVSPVLSLNFKVCACCSLVPSLQYPCRERKPYLFSESQQIDHKIQQD